MPGPEQWALRSLDMAAECSPPPRGSTQLSLAGSPGPPAGAPPDAELGDEPGDEPLCGGREPERPRDEDLYSTSIQGLEGGVGHPLGRDHEPAGKPPGEQARLRESLGLDRTGIHTQHANAVRGELGRHIP
jgi:hypothetical protein